MATLGDDIDGIRKAIHELTRNNPNQSLLFASFRGDLVDRIVRIPPGRLPEITITLLQQPARSHRLR
ncbi:MAG TPA: hypothetical protein VF333_09755, partial [Pyrinomonadaceae bacterium]